MLIVICCGGFKCLRSNNAELECTANPFKRSIGAVERVEVVLRQGSKFSPCLCRFL